MMEIETRTVVEEGSSIACLDAAASDLSAELSFPGGLTKQTYLNCKDTAIGFSFGRQGHSWYLREGNVGAGAYVMSIAGETLVEGYLWFPSSDGVL